MRHAPQRTVAGSYILVLLRAGCAIVWVIALVVPTLYGLAGALLCATVHGLSAAAHRRDRPALVAFTGMCLFAALAAIFFAQSMQAINAAEFLRALRLNGDCVIVATWAATVFVTQYVGHRGRIARAALAAYGVLCLALIGVNEFTRYGLAYQHYLGITYLTLPWGERIAQGVGRRGGAAYFAVVLVYGAFPYALGALLMHYRRTRRSGSMLLLICAACLVPVAIVGALVHLSSLRGFASGPLGFLLLAAAMSAALLWDTWDTHHALYESEQRFRVLFERAPAAMVAIDPHSGRIQQANAVARAVSGYAVADLQRQHFTELMQVEERGAATELVDEMLAGRIEECRLESSLRCRDGRVRICDCAVSAQKDDHGRVVSFIVCLIDITERKRIAAQLERESATNLAFLRNASDGIHILDPAGFVIEASDSFCAMIGYPRETVIGMHVSRWDALFTTEQLAEILSEDFDRSQPAVLETRHRRRDGTIFEAEVSSVAMQLHGSRVLFNSSRDVSDRKRTETRLRESEMRLRTLFEQSPAGISFSRDGMTLEANARYVEMFGYEDAAQVRGTAYLERIAASARTQVKDILERRHVGNGAPSEYETTGLRRDGSEFPLFVTARRIELADGPLTVACMLDFTERKHFEERIRHLAFFDQLTRLPNRELLQDRLNHAIHSGTGSARHGALLLFGLDDFKSVNDTLGHAAGDALLQQVASRLATELREGDTVARMGGDEFMVLLERLDAQPSAAGHAETIGLKMLRALSVPYAVCGTHVHVNCSVGATVVSGHRQGAQELIQQVDIALNQAKTAGRGMLRFFDPRMQQMVSSRVTLESELRKALAARQLVLHYQRQVDGVRNVIGAEALLRWNHPVRGVLTPAEYIALAEQTQMIVPIGAWALDSACAQLALWSAEARTRELSLAVNVSPLQFAQPDFVEQVRRVIARHGVDARRLRLELTETVLQGDLQRTVRTMRLLKQEGVQFSLDDFGTGYSSLQYLKRLPLDQLKIDKSFIRDIVTDTNDKAIVVTIITMARHLGLEVIAEGVETNEQFELLREFGCGQYQGYLFGHPIEARRLFER